MSLDTKDIKSLPIATSLSSSDYLLTSNGQRISEQNVGKRNLEVNLGTGAKWIRIAKFTGASAGLISIANSWNNLHPSPILLAFACSASQYGAPKNSDIKMMSGTLTVFSKARIVYKLGVSVATDFFLEVYQHSTSEVIYYVEMQNYRNAVALCELGAIPEGYTSKEFDLIAVGGGVKRYSSINYAILQKGGLRNGIGDERFDQLSDKGSGSGCDIAPRLRNPRHRHALRSWNLPYKYKYGAEPAELDDVRHDRGHCSTRVCNSEILSENHDYICDGYTQWTQFRQELEELDIRANRGYTFLATERRVAA